jgi:hypothetical protein
MATRGGKRQGAGVKQDSIRPNFFAFVTPEDITDYMDWVKKNYKKDPRLAKWYGDHLFGQAIQPLSNPDGSSLTITFDRSFDAPAQ